MSSSKRQSGDWAMRTPITPSRFSEADHDQSLAMLRNSIVSSVHYDFAECVSNGSIGANNFRPWFPSIGTWQTVYVFEHKHLRFEFPQNLAVGHEKLATPILCSNYSSRTCDHPQR